MEIEDILRIQSIIWAIYAQIMGIQVKIREFHEKWDCIENKLKNRDFEDKFAPNGQIYHDFEENREYLVQFRLRKPKLDIFLMYNSRQIEFQFDVHPS